jgi:phosphoesterase RecJ-like protein
VPPPAELLALLQTRASFVLVTHVAPDGDALGSALGLALALQGQGRSATVVCPSPPGDLYQWLPGAAAVTTSLPPGEAAVVLLDCDALSRTDTLAPALADRPLTVLDHHTGAPFGDLIYKDTAAAATCVLVYRLLQALSWPLTPDLATCLFTGLATDTGFFRYENTNPEALAVASELVAAGALPHLISERVNEARPLGRTQLTGRALASLQTGADDRVIWGLLRPVDYRETRTAASDTEGIIDIVKQVAGQQACVLLKAPEDEQHWQVSLRSPVVDVAEVARHYGGGGHARASGFEYEGELEPLRADLLARLAAALPPRGGTP